VKNAIEAAVLMSPEEQAERMRAMRDLVGRNTAADWATGFINTLESQ
jgi:trehalose-6-phosphate synthase